MLFLYLQVILVQIFHNIKELIYILNNCRLFSNIVNMIM